MLQPSECVFTEEELEATMRRLGRRGIEDLTVGEQQVMVRQVRIISRLLDQLPPAMRALIDADLESGLGAVFHFGISIGMNLRDDQLKGVRGGTQET